MATPKVPKDLKKLAAAYKAKGWELVTAGSGHTKWYDPAGVMVTSTSSTPSNGHTVAKKTASILARHETAVAA